MRYLSEFKKWLAAPVDGHVLGLFRLVFGLFMVFEAWLYYGMGLIEKGLLAPTVLFKYDGLGWLPLLPKPLMLAILGIMGLSALFIALGVWFRWACWAFVLSLSFIFFQEKSYYNNHIYLFILLGVLLSFTNADHFLSLRSRNKGEGGRNVPRWQQFILQAQFVIVYFYGGLTKLKPDWLFLKEPVTSLVNNFPAGHWLAPVFKTDLTINLLNYGGLLLDLLAPLLLWYKPLRRWAMIPFALFHLANSRIFSDIGIFPYVMLFALILFFETQELPFVRKWASQQPADDKQPKQKHKAHARQTQPSSGIPRTVQITNTPVWVANVLVGYFVFQLLFPFRGFFLPNPMDWTGIGKHFSWRMKVDTRHIEEFQFTVQHPVTGQVMAVEVGTFANEMQILNMANDARSVAVFARMLREQAALKGVPDAIVKARIRVGYNGRPAQFFVNPDVDMASVTYSPFKKLDWVVPLQE
ncbi:MAG TPA: HTTM domain-containing protein [Saprospiraceae bacterium]|nr:HTTM domain-containing protein [Saprospiraceae bacterium]